ncbi:MAG: aminotransferase class V-fold PLP-dependent enzyme, partial [Bacteroidota bacterium]
GCTFLSATGRKYLRGPRGTGFLYVNQKILPNIEPIMLDLKGAIWEQPEQYSIARDATRFENWERSPALQLGIGRAATYAQQVGMDRIWERIQHLGNQLRGKLRSVPGVHVMDRGKYQCGIVSIAIEGKDTATVKAGLLEANVNVSLIDPKSTLIDSLNRQLPSMIRASVHYYNTEDELDQFIHHLKEQLT